jgi:type I restriction enzyme R subunit
VHPERNEFVAVNQFTIVVGGNNRRPDVLLFVNGFPLAQLELKKPGVDEDGRNKAVNQVQHYRKTIPGLYRYVEVIGVNDLLRARVGTITTPPEHFAEWKSMDPAAMEGRSQLEILIREVFTPTGLLDLIRNFVLFETAQPAGASVKLIGVIGMGLLGWRGRGQLS